MIFNSYVSLPEGKLTNPNGYAKSPFSDPLFWVHGVICRAPGRWCVHGCELKRFRVFHAMKRFQRLETTIDATLHIYIYIYTFIYLFIHLFIYIYLYIQYIGRDRVIYIVAYVIMYSIHCMLCIHVISSGPYNIHVYIHPRVKYIYIQVGVNTL